MTVSIGIIGGNEVMKEVVKAEKQYQRVIEGVTGTEESQTLKSKEKSVGKRM